MRTLHHSAKEFDDELAAFCRGAAAPREVAESVAAILAEVRGRGDEAVSYYAAKFDGAKLRGRDFRVSAADLAAAAKRLPASETAALTAARDSIMGFNRRGLPKGWKGRNPHGAIVGEKFDPIRRVGLYVPGGSVPLVSTVLMTATLAKIARCPEVVVCTPSNPEGRVADPVLAALHLLGIEEVYRIGGVQAIGAMAFGTMTIPAVDKIFGPGNAYVCEAKRQVFGVVGIDSLPGPSEVMIIADDKAPVAFVAADLLAQAEHGSGHERICLVTTAPGLLNAIDSEMRTQLQLIGRSEKVQQVLESGFLAIEAKSLSHAAAIANAVAPEHLELLVRETAIRRLTSAITTAGAIMIGRFSPTALGDYAAGPSHVLPTGGAGRYFSGLRVADFIRRTSVIRYERASLKKAGTVVNTLAGMEQLDAHARSVRIRLR